MADIIFNRLNSLGISYKKYNHEPLFTVDQALEASKTIPGAQCKNLFLKDSKKRLYLVVAVHNTLINFKKLSKILNAPELRFAQADLLNEYLAVEPGSVTPFALINDKSSKVIVILDTNLFKYKEVGFHPLINSATLVIESESLKKFVESCGHSYQIINFEEL